MAFHIPLSALVLREVTLPLAEIGLLTEAPAMPNYIGIVTSQGVVRSKGYASTNSVKTASHADLWPFETHDLAKHWRIYRESPQHRVLMFDDPPTQDDYFAVLNWAHGIGLAPTFVQIAFGQRHHSIKDFDPRQLREARKTCNEAFHSMTPNFAWTQMNGGYDFQVMARTPTGRKLVGRNSSLPNARVIAKNYYRQTHERVEIVDSQGRKFFTLG